MSQEINVLSRTQVVTVDKPSGTVVINNAGAVGPAGASGIDGIDGEDGVDGLWQYIAGELSPEPSVTTPLNNFTVLTTDGFSISSDDGAGVVSSIETITGNIEIDAVDGTDVGDYRFGTDRYFLNLSDSSGQTAKIDGAPYHVDIDLFDGDEQTISAEWDTSDFTLSMTDNNSGQPIYGIHEFNQERLYFIFHNPPTELGFDSEFRMSESQVRFSVDGTGGVIPSVIRLEPDAFYTDCAIVIVDSILVMNEISAPSAPSVDTGYVYIRDNGSGKTQLVVRFPTGAVQVIATEP